jgi:PAS domain S-box-containing protein
MHGTVQSPLSRILERTARMRSRPAFGYAFAALAFVVALLARFALAGVLPPAGFPFLTFFPAVLLTAFLSGLGPGLLASAVSVVAAWYFFVQPHGSLLIVSAADAIALLFFAAILLVDCVVIDTMNRALERNAKLQGELERVVNERTRERDRAWRLSQDLLVVADADGTLMAVNAAWTTLLGWEERELVGKPFMPFAHPEDLEPTLKVFASILEAPLTTPYDYRLRHKDSTYRRFAWTAAFEDGRVYASGRHTTAEHEQREALREAEAQLRQAQKMEAVGQLTGGIAHDFNNMLAIVVGSLDMLRRRLATGDAEANARHLRLVDNAMEGATKAATLTQRLLAFSRQQTLEPVPLDPNKLVAGMSDLLRRTLTESVVVETVLAAGLWRTHADPGQLESALLNLAVNARDAMPEGGRLTIETANCHLDEAYAREHLGIAAGQYIMIAVSDTGSGMPPDVMARAFDPFFSTKEVGKGTGLGLSQVYGFVKQSGGHVKIYSEPDQGTTVKLYLPRYAGAVGLGAEPDHAPPLPRGDGRETIMVVEDEAGVRRFSVEALTELGYRVVEARDSDEALRALDAHPEVKLLFTDVVMPGANGNKLADEAQRRRPGLKVLYTTGYTRNAVVHNGVLDAGVHLLGKPFTVDQLARKVADVLDEPVADGARVADAGLG